MSEQFLPLTPQEMRKRGWERPDFVYITGDAYVDHPSFGTAVISRVLESFGYKVCILSQPDWREENSVRTFGRPRLGFLISAGNMDSMVNHCYVSRKRRNTDAYTPGGRPGKRPDRAVTVYSRLVRKCYPDIPIILGGIEASLRRMAHYDYWSDSFRPSVLLESQADLISYGMGEKSIVEIAEALSAGIAVSDITFVAGTVYRTKSRDSVYDGVLLPSYEDMKKDPALYADSFWTQYRSTDPINGKTLIEPYADCFVVQNPPQPPLTTQEMDNVYDLPYMRRCHPSYDALGGVPAASEVRFSLVSSRGCFGGCSFCSLTFHQGRCVQVRSHESLLREAEQMTREPDFKGYIHDVGGPTANFRHPSCEKQLKSGVCQNRQCLFPKPCPNLDTSHRDYIGLLRKLRALPGVKKVFIRSGIRFDYLLAEGDDAFLRELVCHHVSGQLKVAPEHVADAVLYRMGKPENAVYETFVRKYERLNEKLGLKQYLVPYLMSSHPGSSLKEAVQLAEYLRDLGYMPQQVQDFYPTPSTLSTVMYYTGIDPRDGSKVYVCRNSHEKMLQRALIQYRDPANYALVHEALVKAGRQDLIGYGPKCLIRPKPGEAPGKGTGAEEGQSRRSRGTKINAGEERSRRSPEKGKAAGKEQNGKSPGKENAAVPRAGKKKTIRNIHPKKK